MPAKTVQAYVEKLEKGGRECRRASVLTSLPIRKEQGLRSQKQEKGAIFL